MSDTPKPRINNAIQLGKANLGLTPETASIEDCKRAIEYITEGHVTLAVIDGKLAFIGDKTEEASLMAHFYQHALLEPIFINLPPLEKLAHATNRLASKMDKQAPETALGIPSRMEMLYTFQHNNGLDLER